MARLGRRRQHRTGADGDDESASVRSVSQYTAGSSRRHSDRVGITTATGRLGTGRANSLSARGSGPDRGNGGGGLGDAAYTGPIPEWSVLDQLAAQMQRQDTDKQLRKQRELQQRLRNDLERQMADSHYKQTREREQEKLFVQGLVEESQLFRQREEKAEASRNEKLRLERCEQLEQVKGLRARQEEQRERDRREAEEFKLQLERDLQADRQRAEQRLVQRRGLAQEALTIGNESVKMREDAKRRAAQREEQAVEEYERMRAKRDNDLRETYQEELNRREDLATLMAESLAAPATTLQLRTSGRSVSWNQREMELGKQREETLAKATQLTQNFQMQQMQEKQHRKQSEHEHIRQMRQSSEQDAIDFMEAEMRKEASRRRLQFQHREELEKQIAAKLAVVTPGKDSMTECELQLNRPLLVRAQNSLTAERAD